MTGVYYSPNHLALYLERVWPLALALAVCAGLKGWRRRWMWLGVLVVGAALYLTYSRGAWLLAVPAALAVVSWCYRRYLRWWLVGLGLALLLVVTSNVFLGRLASHSALLDEVRSEAGSLDGFVVGTGDALPKNTPMPNLHAITQAVRDYGRGRC